jgi:intracellular proteinase inhibitor BsuPI
MTSPGRMMARLMLVVGAALLTFGYSSCTFVSNTGGTGGSSGSGVGDGFSTTLVLRDSSGTATSSFVMGEPIRFELEIQSRTTRATTLQFPDSQIYDFYVLDAAGSGVRWRWSEGMTFTQVSTQLSFAPLSSKSYSVTWNGVLGDGTQLPAGNYRAQGIIVSDDQQDSNLVPFTVR